MKNTILQIITVQLLIVEVRLGHANIVVCPM